MKTLTKLIAIAGLPLAIGLSGCTKYNGKIDGERIVYTITPIVKSVDVYKADGRKIRYNSCRWPLKGLSEVEITTNSIVKSYVDKEILAIAQKQSDSYLKKIEDALNEKEKEQAEQKAKQKKKALEGGLELLKEKKGAGK